MIRYVLLILAVLLSVLLFLNCNNTEEESNLKIKKIAKEEISKDNIFFYHKKNYSEAIEYFIYKKYGLIDYLELYKYSIDTSFINMMNTSIKQKKIFINNIKSDIDSLSELEKKKYNAYLILIENDKKFVDRQYNEFFYDGYLSSILNTEYPTMIYPSSFYLFNKSISNDILKKDAKFSSVSLWVVIDKKGNVKCVEVYKKYSTVIDNFILEKVKETKWTPSILKNSKDTLETRIKIKITNT